MKKLFTLLLLSFSVFSVLKAQSVMDYSLYNTSTDGGVSFNEYYKYTYDYDAQGNLISRIVWKWDTGLSEYVITAMGGKATYAYDANGNQIQIIGYNYDASTSVFTPSYKIEYTYDDDKNITSYFNFNAYDASTETFKATVFYAQGYVKKYDINGNVIEHEKYEGDAATGVHIPKTKSIYVFDDKNNQIEEISLTWDATGSEWVELTKTKIDFVYDANNNPTSEIHSDWDYGTSAWVENIQKKYYYTYTYDVNNRITEKLEEQFNFVSGSGNMINGKYTYEYDLNGNTTKISWFWTATFTLKSIKNYAYDTNGNLILEEPLKESLGNWIGDGNKFVYAYDANGNQLEYRRFKWDSGTASWVGESNAYYAWTQEFDANGLVINKYTYKWDMGTSDWITVDENLYFYKDLATAVENVDSFNYSVYPNPSQGLFTVANAEVGTRIAVYSLTGAQVYETLSNSSVMNIDISSQPDGVYLLVVGDEKYKVVKN